MMLRKDEEISLYINVKNSHLPAVHIVKTTWTESKKKNITRRETDAPIGRNSAWVESIVWIPETEK